MDELWRQYPGVATALIVGGGALMFGLIGWFIRREMNRGVDGLAAFRDEVLEKMDEAEKKAEKFRADVRGELHSVAINVARHGALIDGHERRIGALERKQEGGGR